MQPIVLLEGDGIGPEIMAATVMVLEATGLPIEFIRYGFGEASGEELTDDVLAAIRTAGTALKGPTATPKGTGHRSLNVQLREALDLYVNVRPVVSIPGVITRYSDVSIDMLLYRMNFGDLYAGIEYMRKDGVAVAEAQFNPQKIRQLASYVLTDAVRRGRKRLTIVSKPNINKLTHGEFFNDIVYDVARTFPEIAVDDLIADNALAQLIARPERFNSIITTNLFGDIFSDGLAAMIGGLGVAPGANIGDRYAVFEAVHGTAPDIAGKGIANPTSLILSAAMMLDHIGETDGGTRIRNAVFETFKEGSCVTGDINRQVACSTQDFAKAVARLLYHAD